jgi:signal peptidase II
MWAAWAIGAAVLVIAAVADPALRVATALMLGGAFANLFEHTRRGTVTDYICLGWWPAFNLADAALMAGAAGYGFAVWRILASSASRGL